MEQKIANLIKDWDKKNIRGAYYKNKKEAGDKILEIISKTASVGMSGSLTLGQLDIIKQLEERGNKVFNQNQNGITRGESLELRKQGTQADCYLTSANAVSLKGELVFFSAYGNRTAGISYAKKVIVVCGINKIAPNLEEALKRSREYATPLNCKRLEWNAPCFKDGICRKEICLFPEYKRMCCQILIVEAEAIPDRLTVILVGESLGF